MLDLVVDFLTYVFVPAYAHYRERPAASHSPPPCSAQGLWSAAHFTLPTVGMKTADNHFRGFPAHWNAAAFYLFLLHPSPVVSSLAIAALIVLTFVPFYVLHPVRVKRLRGLNLSLIAVWAGLAILTIAKDFNVAMPVTAALCAIALYVICGDAVIRVLRRKNR